MKALTLPSSATLVAPAVSAVPAIAYGELEKMAIAIARSGLFGVKEPNQAIALCLIAQAEGLHPAVAARDYNIIQGRPAKNAEAMHRAFLQAGGKIEWHRLDDEVADATFSHPQGGVFRCVWDLERARQAGLIGKDMWKKYPRAMLRSRCISEGCRTINPMSTSGLYTPEEVRDMEHDSPVVSVVEAGRDRIGSGSSEHRHLEARITELGLDRDRVKAWCKRRWGFEHLPDLSPTCYRALLARLPEFAARSQSDQPAAGGPKGLDSGEGKPEPVTDISFMQEADRDCLFERAPGLDRVTDLADVGGGDGSQ